MSGPAPERGGPAVSVIFGVDSFATIRRMISFLERQTVADQLEIVLASPDPDALGLETSELLPFHSHRVVRVDSLASLRAAKAAAIQVASAPIVALAETHCFPDPGWAEALIAAHRGPWAAVCPAIGNANPDSWIGWSNLLLDYGPWLHPHPGGEMANLPANNTSYKRDLLLEYGADLADRLEAETALHADLRERGHRLRLEPTAVARHLNVSRPSAWLSERYLVGRFFAGHRAADWSPARRALYVLGAPLIPPLRLVRMVRDLRRAGLLGSVLPRVLPAFVLGALASAIGETMGTVMGPGPVDRVSEIELHRSDYVRGGEGLQSRRL